MKKPYVIAAVLAGGLAVAGFLAFYLAPTGPDLVKALPTRPEFAGFPQTLVNRVARAEARVRRGPEPIEGLKSLSRLYHANGYLDEAAACYEVLAQVEPEEPRWFHRWATIVAGFGYLEEALPLWEYVLELEPDYLPAYVRLGDALLKLNRLSQAGAVFDRALNEQPDNPYALTGRARTEIARGDWAAARPLLERAARLSDFRIGTDLLASVYRNLGEDTRADSLLRTTSFGGFIDIEDPWMDSLNAACYDAYRLATAGGMAEFRGDVKTGLAYMERAVALEPDKALHHYQLARMANTLGDPARAETHYRRAIELQPDLADAYVYLIALLDEQGRPDEARSVLFKGYHNCPNSPSMHMEMAKYFRAIDRMGAALQAVDEAIELRPNEAGAYLLKARFLLQDDRVEDGVAAMRAALEAEPGNLLALSTLALHAIKAGWQDEAQSLMRRVYLQPRMPTDIVADLEREYQARFGEPAS